MSYPRILCPVHAEKTPSCVIYGETWKCYGCGAHGLTKEIKERTYVPEVVEQYVEDLEKTMEYIESLPLERIRGLSLPADPDAYYIVWPEKNYYKKRLRNCAATAGKYRGPAGHPKPLFRLRPAKPSSDLVVVEGELNALSVREAARELEILSPGSASDYANRTFAQAAPTLAGYKRILILADKDKAGVRAAIRGKAILNQYVRNVRVVLMEEDANEILQTLGPEGLRHFINGCL